MNQQTAGRWLWGTRGLPQTHASSHSKLLLSELFSVIIIFNYYYYYFVILLIVILLAFELECMHRFKKIS